MKTYSFQNFRNVSQSIEIESLSIFELAKIIGGVSDDRSKSKETDVYDTREV